MQLEWMHSWGQPLRFVSCLLYSIAHFTWSNDSEWLIWLGYIFRGQNEPVSNKWRWDMMVTYGLFVPRRIEKHCSDRLSRKYSSNPSQVECEYTTSIKCRTFGSTGLGWRQLSQTREDSTAGWLSHKAQSKHTMYHFCSLFTAGPQLKPSFSQRYSTYFNVTSDDCRGAAGFGLFPACQGILPSCTTSVWTKLLVQSPTRVLVGDGSGQTNSDNFFVEI